jgi:hypothetical protein
MKIKYQFSYIFIIIIYITFSNKSCSLCFFLFFSLFLIYAVIKIKGHLCEDVVWFVYLAISLSARGSIFFSNIFENVIMIIF